jgi:hypothetical protein
MIKITFDGNNTEGYTILAEIPYDILVHKPGNAGKCLFCDESPDNMRIEDLLPWTRDRILAVEEVNIFEHEMVIIHTDSLFDPGPHDGLRHHEELIREAIAGGAGPTEFGLPNSDQMLAMAKERVAQSNSAKDEAYYKNYNSSEELLEAVAQGKVDVSSLPESYSADDPGEDTLGVGAPPFTNEHGKTQIPDEDDNIHGSQG